MVNPERIGRRITGYEIDRKNSDAVLIYIDVSADHLIRWTLEYNVRRRRFSAYAGCGPNVRCITKKMKTFLLSRLPPEHLAYCTAVSLGVAN